MSEIFKAYDIRGKYPQEINQHTACLIGQAFLDFVKEKTFSQKPKIVIGYDSRKSSQTLFSGLVNGLNPFGSLLMNIGRTPIDVFYFAFQYLQADGGIMITASHNPLNWNGFKMIVKNYGFVYQGRGMENLKSKFKKYLSANRQFRNGQARKLKIKTVNKNIVPEYLNQITKIAKKLGFLKNRFSSKIGIDFLNGAAMKIIKPAIKKFHLLAHCLNSQTNQPDPTLPKNLKNLQKLIKEKKLDFGMALDGDGDRCVFLDEKGQTIDSSFILLFFSLFFLKKNPKAKIAYGLNCSRIVREEIEKQNGHAIRCPIGHVFIKKIALKSKAIFGGELSGHFFWQENHYSECPLLALLLLKQILSERKQKLSALIKPLRKYYQEPEIIIKQKTTDLKKIASFFRKGNSKIDFLDGLTMEFPDWWFNLRVSGTEPILKLRIETANRIKFLEKKREILQLIKSSSL